jgi:hypothetical protein
LAKKSEENRPLEKHWGRWEDNIKTDVSETGWEGLDWVHVTHGRHK